MLHKLTNRLANSLYIFSKKATAPANYLPLYQSSVFRTDNFEDIFNSSESARRYKQLLPVLASSVTIGLYPARYLYTSLAFDPNNETLKIVTLRAAGFHTQQFSINNIIPYTYRDMLAQSKIPEPLLPVFLDDEMIYFNKAIRETLFAERDGTWNAETIAHPKLSLEARVQEKEWFDRQQVF